MKRKKNSYVDKAPGRTLLTSFFPATNLSFQNTHPPTYPPLPALSPPAPPAPTSRLFRFEKNSRIMDLF